ncbi:unnamed protein product [Psylliodes chrysocephalus]|uniref:Uncharacterized protein n=1 Tax=Psylliodes chrysocephalus TaxID=3402493 RepID=A0A9P0CSZ1_9CUCU|nr:unnamed protein product [Psylliodes chrysocephala]
MPVGVARYGLKFSGGGEAVTLRELVASSSCCHGIIIIIICSQCGSYEVVNQCASKCVDEPTCQNPNPIQKPGTPCLAICVKRCECDAKNGWIRSSSNGTCIQKSTCKSEQCGPHEIVNKCASKCVDEPTCQNPNPIQKPGTPCLLICVKRCECDAKNGWIRSSSNGACIQKSTCKSEQCGPNEVVNKCASKCVDEATCQNPNPIQKPGTPCVLICVKRCECDAKNGWIRSSPNGPCIQKSTCKSEQCGPHEVVNQCASKCVDEPTCQNPNPIQKPGTPCLLVCVKRCECDAKNGWIRSSPNGTCIQKSTCKSEQCGPHEVVNQCASKCVDEATCQNPTPIQKPGTPCVLICEKRCECDAKNGWIRSSPNGTCIQKSTCKSEQCGPHEIVNKCASKCVDEPTCQNPNPIQKPGTPCLLICVKRCECDAKNGWIRSSPNGPCIQKPTCKSEQCGPHEVVNQCASKCVDEATCQNPNPIQKPGTPCLDICVKRCECDTKNGWIRSSPNGPCIQKSTCKSEQCGPHEVVNQCASKCVDEATCQNPNPIQKPGTPCLAICVKRCECDAKNGWIRSSPNGPCIQKSTCKSEQCGPNEVVNQCASKCVDEATCQNPNPIQKPGTPCVLICVKRCECDAKNGWIRSSPNGTCIQKSTCKSEQCGPNEIVNECASKCVGEPTCQIPNPTQEPGTACITLCVKRCECDAKNGWIRATSKGVCIKKDACPSGVCPKHEKQGCAPCCPDPTCQNREPSCPDNMKCPKICRLTCRCKKRFIRDISTGKCVPKGRCPKTKC